VTTNYGDIGPKAAAYSASRMLGKSRMMLDHFGSLSSNLPQVKPLQATCRYCGAEAGERCTRWRRTKRGMVKQVRHSPHPDRVYDAKLATQAARTLITGDEPDTVVFRSPGRLHRMQG
jgi:hypothetical protein